MLGPSDNSFSHLVLTSVDKSSPRLGTKPCIYSCRYSVDSVETRVAAILSPAGFLQSTAEDGDGPLGLVLERTTFYAEQGGQVADTGSITSTSGARLEVHDTQV